MIFVEEIVEVMTVARFSRGEDAKSGEVGVAPQTFATHDECADDGFANARQFGKGATQFGGWYFENF